jgi:tocopherol O-methyltransferase
MPATLSQRIQRFYDASSGLWEEVWGEHMHHGFYGWDGKREGGRSAPNARKQAQVDLIEELLAWGQPSHTDSIVDVGCGIGGSSLYLAQKYNATVTGITLSPVQAHRATARAQEANLLQQAQFKVADALDMPFADSSFDVVWTLESGEHMPDKTKFLQECHRVLKPGGSLLMATWCHRDVNAPQSALTSQEKKLLDKIYRIYHLPYVISLPDYAQIAERLGFEQIRTADWSDAVAPFWDDVIASALSLKVLPKILTAGWPTLQGAFALQYMSAGYRQGLIRFGLLRATK